jgi:hypothetical protein
LSPAAGSLPGKKLMECSLLPSGDLAHDPEKREAVFGQDHAQTAS